MDKLDVMARFNAPGLIKWVRSNLDKYAQSAAKAQTGKETQVLFKTKIEKALKVLDTWDFTYGIESAGAAVYETWEYYFTQSIFADQVKDRVARSRIWNSYLSSNYISIL